MALLTAVGLSLVGTLAACSSDKPPQQQYPQQQYPQQQYPQQQYPQQQPQPAATAPGGFTLPTALPSTLPTALPSGLPTALPSGWLPPAQ